MLTEAEIEWLRRRESLCERCGKKQTCGFPKAGNIVKCSCCWFEEKASGNDDYRDAAEFEARVAEKLAKSICVVCPENKNGRCPTRQNYAQRADIEACRMRHARIAVEKEMDSEKKLTGRHERSLLGS